MSLSREELRNRPGDPSRMSVIDCGDEEIGSSLVVEDIGKADQRMYSERVNTMRAISSKKEHHAQDIQITPFCVIPKVEMDTCLGEGGVQRIVELGKTFDKLKTIKSLSWASFFNEI